MPSWPSTIKTALDDVDDLTVVGDGDRSGGIHGAADIILVDDAPGDAHHAAAVDRGDMRARQADQGGGDLQPGGALGLLDRAGDSLGGGPQVYHYSLS